MAGVSYAFDHIQSHPELVRQMTETERETYQNYIMFITDKGNHPIQCAWIQLQSSLTLNCQKYNSKNEFKIYKKV